MANTWDQSRFDQTVKQYLMEHETSTWPNLINKKAFYVVRKSIWYTRKVDPSVITRELQETKAADLVKLKSGRFSRNKKNIRSYFGSYKEPPRLALIIQSRVTKGGKERSPWYGKPRSAGASSMFAKMRQVFGARMSSIAFIKSGWIGAREALKKSFTGSTKGLPSADKYVKSYSRQLGGATPATSGNLVATIWNDAKARHDHKAALERYGGEGLQAALDDETNDMIKYLEGELQPGINKFNSQQH